MVDPIREALERAARELELMAVSLTQAGWTAAASRARNEAHTARAATMPEPDTDAVLTLAAIIREVDGSHRLGAAALAEAILCHPDAAGVFSSLEPGSVVAGLPDTSQKGRSDG